MKPSDTHAPGFPSPAQAADSEWLFLAVAALIFILSAVGTIAYALSVSAMDMPMPMAGMPMCGQNELGSGLRSAASFLAMWMVMTVAMMLPSLLPMLRGFRRAPGAIKHRDGLTLLAAGGYFAVWGICGVVVYALRITFADAQMRWPLLTDILPIAAGLLVVLAGLFQFTNWKAEALHCCRTPMAGHVQASGVCALRYGVRLGCDCVRCCANLMAVLIVLGMMDLRMMAAITIAITLERIVPHGIRMAHASGLALMCLGALMLAQTSIIL